MLAYSVENVNNHDIIRLYHLRQDTTGRNDRILAFVLAPYITPLLLNCQNSSGKKKCLFHCLCPLTPTSLSKMEQY